MSISGDVVKKGSFVEVNGVRAEIVFHESAGDGEVQPEVKFTGGSVVESDWQKLKAGVDEAIVKGKHPNR